MTSNIFFNGSRIAQLISIPWHSRSDYETQELQSLTYSVPLFSRLRVKYSNEIHEKFLNHLSIDYFTKNQILYAKGDSSNKYFILLKGEVALYQSVQSKDSDISSSDNSSDEINDEDFAKLLRPRSKAITINPSVLYDISQKLNKEPNKENEIISKEALENESQELVEFIIQSNILEGNSEGNIIITPGSDFGQEALCPSKKRVMNAVAKSDIQVAVINSGVIAKVIKDVSRERTLRMFDFLQSVTLFIKWSRYEIRRILGFFKLKVFSKGQYLYKQGQTPTHIYLIRKGNFAISKNSKQETTKPDLNSSNLRSFSSKRQSRTFTIDLVIKCEKEVVGSEEIIQGLSKRIYSCVCNTAIGEVYEISSNNFLQKLVKPELFESFSLSLKNDLVWLNERYKSLENRDIVSCSFDSNEKTSTIYNRQPRKSFDFFNLTQKKTIRLHTRGVSERKEYEKGWKNNNSSNLNWGKCETGNIHLGNLKKKNPRLAPPNFLYKVRPSPGKRGEVRFSYDRTDNQSLAF